MAIYLVTPLNDNYQKLKDVITDVIPEGDFFCLQNNAGFLVRSNLTAIELAYQLNISTPDRSPTDMGAAMVTSVTSYYGRASTAMWDWLKTRMERG